MEHKVCVLLRESVLEPEGIPLGSKLKRLLWLEKGSPSGVKYALIKRCIIQWIQHMESEHLCRNSM